MAEITLKNKHMAYDIYGERLERGHCEVHPHVHEEYPCSICMQEDRQQRSHKSAEKEYYAQMEKDMYEAQADDYCTKYFKTYRMLKLVERLLNKILVYIQHKKDVIKKDCPF